MKFLKEDTTKSDFRKEPIVFIYSYEICCISWTDASKRWSVCLSPTAETAQGMAQQVN